MQTNPEDNSEIQAQDSGVRRLRGITNQASSDSFHHLASPNIKNARKKQRNKQNVALSTEKLSGFKERVTEGVREHLIQEFSTEKKYQGRKVSEYYKSRRVKGCFILRALFSILIPLLIAWWVVPIYEKMHVSTDRLVYLKQDWREKYPLSDVKIIDAPLPKKDQILDSFGDDSNIIIEIAEDIERGQSTIGRGLARKDNICTQKFGSQYESLVPAVWQGMAMGCNCTGKNESQQYYEGSCTYQLTLRGCLQMMPFYSIDIQIVAGKWICGLRYSDRYQTIIRPTYQGECPAQTRVCGGTSRETQYCINQDQKCPINDIRLVPFSVARSDTEELSEFYNLNDNFDIEVRRSANQHPIVDLKLSEATPCLDPNRISHTPDRPLISLEFGKLAEGCPLEIDQDQRFRRLSDQVISEHQLYTENKVMDVLRLYTPEEQYYKDGADVNLYLYGSTNFIWNPFCCSLQQGAEITGDHVYTMVESYKTVVFLLVIAIAIICAHVIISGMLLNFLILIPYCKARFVKDGKSFQSTRELHSKLLSGQIPCLEFTRAFVNSMFGFFYLFMVGTILFVAEQHDGDFSIVRSQLAAMPCSNCGAQQELISEELVKVHLQIEELRRFDFLIFAIVFLNFLVDYGLKLLYRETWIKLKGYYTQAHKKYIQREEEENFIKQN